MAIIRPPNSHRRKYYVHHGTPGNFQYCRLSWGWKQAYFHYLQKLLYLHRKCSHLQWDFIARLAKEPRILLFTVDRGPWKWIFFYIYLHFVAEKERCSVQIHQRGRSEMGSVWYLAKIQAPHYSTQLFRVRLKILWGKNFWEKKLKLHFGKYSHTIADKKNCTLETSIMQRWDKSARNWHLLFFRKVNGKRYKGTFIFILMDFQNLVWSQWAFKTQNY